MSETPYIPFYTSDFLGGTSGMTAATKGVYITLLCLMYEEEGPLIQKWETLARRCGCTLPAFEKAVSLLQDDGKVEEKDGGLWSSKCEKHLAQRAERRNSATSAAKKRWQKIKEKQGLAYKAAMREACQPEPEPEEKEDTNVSSKKTAENPPDEVGLDFDRFWSEYPHRGGQKKNRKGAEAKFRLVVKRGVSVDDILAGVSAMRRFPEVQRGFARDPVVWLNQSGWEDEPPPPGFESIGGITQWPDGSLRALAPDRVQEFLFGRWENRNDLTEALVLGHPKYIGRSPAYRSEAHAV